MQQVHAYINPLLSFSLDPQQEQRGRIFRFRRVFFFQWKNRTIYFKMTRKFLFSAINNSTLLNNQELSRCIKFQI